MLFPDGLYHIPHIGSQSFHCVVKSLKIGPQFLDPNFLWGGRPQTFSWQFIAMFTPTMWQSLVEFCRLKCVCEARQWRKTQNFQRVGENCGPILVASGPKFIKFWDNVGEPSWFPMSFPDFLYRVPWRRYWPSKLSLSCEVVIGSRIFWDQYPKHLFVVFYWRSIHLMC